MKKEDLLVTRLGNYGKSDQVPCHMPGHKRNQESWLTFDFPNPFSIDITEIDGFDNLHHPEGILKESMEWASEVYGCDKTWYLVNGSTCGILSSICGTVRPGGRILMSRNCHKSAYHGVILMDAKVSYIYPQIIEDMGIQGGILPEDVENSLDRYPDTEAVLIVSPTYDGIVSDVEKIAKIVHAHGIPLIVDEAHGAHFSFGNGVFPKSAIQCGADLVIQSVHKTLPSFTQTALLHGQKGRIDIDRVERYLQMFQTSSPSYIFIAGIEQCIYEMSQNGKDAMAQFWKRLMLLRKRLENLRVLRILGEINSGLNEYSVSENLKNGVYGIDLSKLVISCRGCRKNLSGEQLGDWLRRDYGIEMEMCGADYAVAILTYMDSQENLDRLADALLEIDESMEKNRLAEEASESSVEMVREKAFVTIGKPEENNCWIWEQPDIRKKPSEAANLPSESLLLEQCEGRISAEFIYLYPPGIPIVTPGECITEMILNQIFYYKELGLPVQGMADKSCMKLRVLKESPGTERKYGKDFLSNGKKRLWKGYPL